MGLNGVQFNIAEDFNQKTNAQLNVMQQQMNSSSVFNQAKKDQYNVPAYPVNEKRDPIEIKLEDAIRRNDKHAIQECQDELAELYRYKYNEYGDRLIATDRETAKQRAKDRVKEMKDEVKEKRTITTFSGKECSETKKQLKQYEKSLINQYMAEGLSKKEAKKKAKAVLPNRVVDLSDHAVLFGIIRKGYRKSYNFVNEHQEMFFEDGKYSDKKFKNFADEISNKTTDYTKGEIKNHRATLSDQTKAANEYNTSRSAMGQTVRAAGGYADKDRTPLYRGAAIAGGFAAGTATGVALSTTVGALSISTSAAEAAALTGEAVATGTASSAALAAAGVSVDLTLAGAATGGGIGTGVAGWLRDKGQTEPEIYAIPRKPEKQPQAEVEEVQEEEDLVPGTTTCELRIEEKQEEVKVKEPTCPVHLNRGESLYDHSRDKLGNTVIGKNGEIKDKDSAQTKRLVKYVKNSYGIMNGEYSSRTDWEFPTEFEGKQLPCEGEYEVHGTVTTFAKNPPKNQGEHKDRERTEQVTNHDVYDCNNNLKLSTRNRQEAEDYVKQHQQTEE